MYLTDVEHQPSHHYHLSLKPAFYYFQIIKLNDDLT